MYTARLFFRRPYCLCAHLAYECFRMSRASCNLHLIVADHSFSATTVVDDGSRTCRIMALHLSFFPRLWRSPQRLFCHLSILLWTPVSDLWTVKHPCSATILFSYVLSNYDLTIFLTFLPSFTSCCRILWDIFQLMLPNCLNHRTKFQ